MYAQTRNPIPGTERETYPDSEVLLHSIKSAEMRNEPYKYWLLNNCLTNDAVDAILRLPFLPPDLGGVSGRRELHNASRTYFDSENNAQNPVCARVAALFQEPVVTSALKDVFSAPINDCFLRIELAKDTDGFWLEPHTDIGVKRFTMILYLSRDAAHRDLGTDIYDRNKQWVTRSPFVSNSALVFVPSDYSYHGFERRPIVGARTSLVINYVTNEWRAREQLAFPHAPVQ
jgi:hypothetical protein